MRLGDMQAPDIVQAAVVALADDRVHTAGGLADIGVALQHIFDQRRLHGAHTQGVGKQDGGLQRAQLIDLDKAGGLAEAVDDMAGRQHLIMEHISGVRQQRGHAGLDIAIRQCAMAHCHARHITDLIALPVGQMPHPEAPFILIDSHKYLSVIAFQYCPS